MELVLCQEHTGRCALYPRSRIAQSLDPSCSQSISVLFHQNQIYSHFIIDHCAGENIGAAVPVTPDRVSNRTSGAVVTGAGLVRLSPSTLRSASPATHTAITVSVVTQQTAGVDEWLSAAVKLAEMVLLHSIAPGLTAARVCQAPVHTHNGGSNSGTAATSLCSPTLLCRGSLCWSAICRGSRSS